MIIFKKAIRLMAVQIFFIFSWQLATAQVSVENFTGASKVNLPIYTIGRGNVTASISLNYYTNGIKVKDAGTEIGVGWQLGGKGFVSRLLKDLPDDVQFNNSGQARTGWMYNTNGTKINNFSISNDNNPATCSDENTDITYINNNFSNLTDLEPDIFVVAAPGLSCSLIYDNVNGVFRTLPYQDLSISYTTSAGRITGFSIVNNAGVKYKFETMEDVQKYTSTTNEPAISHFKREYDLFKSAISYTSTWHLTSIEQYGYKLNMTYNTASSSDSLSSVDIVVGNGTSGSYTTVNLYKVYHTIQHKSLSQIQFFNYDVPVDQVTISNTNPITSITLANGRVYYLTYSKINNHYFLYSFGESGCNAPAKYMFEYSGVVYNPSSSVLPDTSSKQQDFWGYYNANTATSLVPQVYVYPSATTTERYRIRGIPGYAGTVYTLPGADRSANATSSITAAGALTKVILPTGGTATITYESNNYYDNTAATTFAGGGIRVSKIELYDGVSSGNNIVTNYSYTDPTNGISSGRPISLPIFAFTTLYTGAASGLDLWNYSTIRAERSFSNEDVSIVYGKVTKQQTGKGKVLYEYATPATFWDNTASPDWSVTTNNIGRAPNPSCASLGQLKNDIYSYPFTPNINFDFERGALIKSTAYHESGYIVSQTSYTYQRAYPYPNSSPIIVPGFKYNLNAGIYAYAKYGVYCHTSKLLTSQTAYINDVGNTTNDVTKRIQTTTNTTYGSNNHKFPTIIETTRSDGSIAKVYLKYVKDYSFTTFTDQASTSLNALKNLNINTPVEKYQTITRSGVEKTISAELTKFGPYSVSGWTPGNYYFPSQRLRFLSSAGVTDFSVSSITSGNFVNDSRYIIVGNYQSYNYNGLPQTVDDNTQNISSILYNDDLSLPIASVSNAAYDETLYSNFDGADYMYGFVPTSATYTNSIARSGDQSLSITSASYIQKTVKLKANSKNYIFSCWINAPTAGTLTITVTNASFQSFSTNKTFAASPGGAMPWRYVEVKIPVTNMSSTFTVRAQSNVSGYLDDVLFYPEAAEVSTIAYNKKYFVKTAETNTNGVSAYYDYDDFGNLRLVYDQDKNIIQRTSYFNYDVIGAGLSTPAFGYTPGTGILTWNPVTFNITSSNPCKTGITYRWNFGDGTSEVVTSSPTNQAHSFINTGNYTVSLTTSHPVFGTTSTSQTINISGFGVTVSICQSGAIAWYGPSNIQTAACGSNPNNTTNSYYTVNGTTVPSGHSINTYQWQIIYTDGGAGSSSWANTGPNLNQLVVPVGSVTPRPYKIRCIMTTNLGATATSNELFFTVALD